MALAPDGQRVYVSNPTDMTVSVVSTATNTVVATLPSSLFLGPGVLQAPVTDLTVSPDSRRLYVNVGTGIRIIDTTSLTSLNYLGGIYGQMVVSPEGTRLYVRVAGGYSGPDRVLVLDAASLATIADVNLPPPDGAGVHISITPDGRYVHLTRSRTATGSGLAVLDTTTNTIVHERPTPNAYARASETSPNGAYLYVVGEGSTDQLYRFSPTTHLELGTTSGVGGSYDLGFTADSARAYVASSSAVRVIDTATHMVSTTIPFYTDDGNPRVVAVLGANPIEPTPSNFRVTAIDGNRLSLAWNQPASGPASGYVIQGGTTPGGVLGTVPTGSGATSFSFDAPSGVFYLRVHAVTPAGLSPASNEIQVFVNVPRAPSAPDSFRGLASGSTVGLSWRNTTGGGAPTGLVLDVGGDLTASIPLPLAEVFTVADVPPGTYRLSIRAVNDTGSSPPSPTVTLTFPGVCPGPPQVPSNVVVQRRGSLVNVEWDPPIGGPAVTGYVLKVTGAFNGAVPLTATHLAAPVPPGTYNISVLALNPCGAGMETVPQSITVP